MTIVLVLMDSAMVSVGLSSWGAKDCKVLVGATKVELVQVCRLEHQRGEEDEFNRLLV